jgi:serine/threonine protein kinase/HEAT repeat protein/Tfp pilus assembly protein PilZ
VICPSCKAENDSAAAACSHCGRVLSALKVGEVLSRRYEILDLLGQGGMGAVYKAQDRILDEIVAVKVLRFEMSRTPGWARRFQFEIKLARKVSHRNVCRFHEYGEDRGHSYVSMEFVDGVDLRRRIAEKGSMGWDEAFEVAIQISKGLQAIHDVGIVHRDLKTSNVMLDSRGIVRLIDFGAAKRWMADGQTEGTVAGEIIGTPEYMSPEQARGGSVDFRSDLYALGVVVFELFTGRVPFRGESPVLTILKHLREPPPLSGPNAARLPRQLIPILRKALAKAPDDRYATARGMSEALRLARGGPDLEPRRKPTPLRKALPLPPRGFTPPRGSTLPKGTEGGPPARRDTTRPIPPQIAAEAELAGKERIARFISELEHPNVRIRWRAAVGLWEMGPTAKDAVPALTKALEDKALPVAHAAAEALRTITEEREADRLDPPPTTGTGPIDVSSLIDALRHEDVSVREWAAVALGHLGPSAKDAVTALRAALKNTMSGIRDWAAAALGGIGPEASDAIPDLVGALKDESRFVRAAAAAALGAMGPSAKDVVPDLIAAMRDENANVRWRAASALGEIGPDARAAIPALISALEDRDVSTTDAVALALEKVIGKPEPSPPPPPQPNPEPPTPAAPEAADVGSLILSLTTDDHPSVRWRAAAALGDLGPTATEAIPALTGALEDKDNTVRSEAARALGRMDSAAKEAVPALAAALRDGDEVLRHHAAAALGLIGPNALGAVPALIEALKERDFLEPDEAQEALFSIGRAAVPALIEALRDENPRIRGKASSLVARLGGKGKTPVNRYYVENVYCIAGSERMRVANLGTGGLFASTESPPPVGEMVTLVVELAPNTFIKVAGQVSWVNSAAAPSSRDWPPGFGVRFTRIANEDMAAIREVLKRSEPVLGSVPPRALENRKDGGA